MKLLRSRSFWGFNIFIKHQTDSYITLQICATNNDGFASTKKVVENITGYEYVFGTAKGIHFLLRNKNFGVDEGWCYLDLVSMYTYEFVSKSNRNYITDFGRSLALFLRNTWTS